MHAHNEPRLFRNRFAIIREARAVRSTDFDHARARLGHHFGNAKVPADLDQLAARNNRFAIPRQRIQNQQRRRGAIVDNQSRFGAGQLHQQIFGPRPAPSSLAGAKIVFQSAVAGRLFRDRDSRCFGQRRAAQVCVQDDARGVDDAAQPAA